MAVDWTTLSLDQLYDFGSGLSKPRSAFGSGHPFLAFKDVFYNSAVPSHLSELVDSTEEERLRCSVKRGDVFLTRTSETMDELGMSSVALRDVPHATFNGFTKRLRPKNPSVIVPEFARYFFRSQTFRQSVTALSTMSTRASLNNEMLGRLSMPLPSVEEQAAIGQILGTLDDKIELNRRMNETLEAMARALFKSWFVDFDPVRAKADGRDTGLPKDIADLFPDSFEESELGEIPKGWRVATLGDLFVVNPPRRLQKGTVAPYLGMANMPTRGHCAERWIQREVGSGAKFQNGDTLLARITPCLENGKTAFVDFLADGEVGWGSTEYVVLSPKPPIPTFFGYLLAREPEFRDFAIQAMNGSSGRQRVSPESVKLWCLASPPRKVCEAFDECVEPLARMIRSNANEAQTLADTRDALLPGLLAGNLANLFRESA